MAGLCIGTLVRLKNGKTCKVIKELGRGGQGIVYLVSYENKDYALKWYTNKDIINSPRFYDNLNKNINAGSPAPNFVWPLFLSERQCDSFGYMMEVRPRGYEDMKQFMLDHVKFSSTQTLLNACLQISIAFQKLHIRGLSYQDMNDGNFFINPQTGHVLICDNDNVAPDKTNLGILGKVGFMAPEIVEHDTLPNRYTDYYSLAVCLFILIYMNRPFEGAWYLSCPCDNNPEMAKKLFGYNSVFIMDPTNPKNRPIAGVHKNVIKRWPIFPALLRDAFCKTFSKEAILDPTKRLIDKQWHEILLQVRSNFVPCPKCGKATFLVSQKPNQTCLYCQQSIAPNVSLKVGKYLIPMVPNQILYDCLVTNQEDCQKKAAEVIVKNDKIGMINQSDYPWTVILRDGNIKIVNPGSAMPLKSGMKIKFGNKGETGELI